MKNLNFDRINICDVAESDNKKFPNANPDTFHFGARKAKAMIEQCRHDFAQNLNTLPAELYFMGNSLTQSIKLVNHLILFSEVKNIFTSKFENNEYLTFLKNLDKVGKINLYLIKTGSFGEIKTDELKKQIADTNGKSLLSLSHANEYNGLLIPVKEISKICKAQNTLFLLNIKPTIGKYHINLDKLAPDFAVMDLSEYCGGRNSGVLYMKQTVKIPDSSFYQLKNILYATKNNDSESIYKLTKSLKDTEQNLAEHYKTITCLRQYFIKQFLKNFGLKHIIADYYKEGLYTLLCYFFEEKKFGKFLAEKLDTEHVLTEKLNYPLLITKGTYIRFSLGKENTKQEIDLLVAIIKKFIKKV